LGAIRQLRCYLNLASNPSQMKQFFGRKSRSALALVIMISFALHVVAILIFGTIKFVTDVLREEKVFEAAPIEVAPQKEPEYTVNIKQRNQSTPPPRPPAIVVNNPSELDIPTLDIDVNIDSSSVFGRGGGGFGGGGLSQMREMAVTMDLFGAEVTSNNLGVVLDISGSAHSTLHLAIAEIDKSFPRAHMVLVVGCGMSDGTAAIKGGGGKVPGKPRFHKYRDIDKEKEYNRLGRSAPTQLRAFFSKLGENKGEDMERYFERRDNLYVLYGADIYGANFAFDYLLDDHNVDTVYWFADFGDKIDESIIERLTSRLRSNRVTVIAHNFLGQSVGPLATEMAKKTGGTTIELVPGQEKKK